MFNSKLYVPRPAIIENVKKLTYDTNLYTVKFKYNGESKSSSENDYKCGQFVQVSILGAGEAPVSICSGPTDEGCFQLCVRNVGRVTGALHKLKKGGELGIRGPYGNFFDVGELKGEDIIFIAGGIGLAPLRSVIKYVLARRESFGQITLLYGARTKEDIVFDDELKKWSKEKAFDVFTTIDKPQKGWAGHVGVVTTLMDKIKGKSDVKALVCGPPIMIHFVIVELLNAGWDEEDIITTLERHMKCGVGKCGHCYIGGKYVCTDGPVFTYAQINQMAVEV